MHITKRYGCIHQIGKKTNNRCHLCHGRLDPEDYGSTRVLGRDAVNVDHLWPQSWGRDDSPENLLLAHARCNSARGTRDVEDVRLELAGTTEAPRSLAEVRTDTALAGLAGGVLAGTLFAKKNQKFNAFAALLGACFFAALASDWD